MATGIRHPSQGEHPCNLSCSSSKAPRRLSPSPNSSRSIRIMLNSIRPQGVTPGLPLGLPTAARVIQVRDGEIEVKNGPRLSEGVAGYLPHVSPPLAWVE